MQTTLQTKNRGLWGELKYRRVPQVLGLYLVGAWTFMEFLNSIIGRHNLSPHWADITLVVLLLMLPSVVILAYRHGAPGAQDWSKIEKLGIPFNTLVVAAILFINFADKDLGDRAEMIEAMTPDGNMLTVIRPKEEYKKRILVGFFKLRSDELDNSDKFGLPYALVTDLNQDPYTYTFSVLNFTRPLIEAGFTDMSAPLALMLKVARDNRIKYYVTGEIIRTTTEQYQIAASIYNVESGNKTADILTQPQFDLFAAVDELTPLLKSEIGIPDFIISESQDLPVEEQITSNRQAYLKFINSIVQINLHNKLQEGETLLNEAIELDPTFAIALANMASSMLMQTRITEGLEMLKRAEMHSYRLNVNGKFQLATFGNIFKGERDKAFATIDQWLTLYPESIQAWSAKITLLQSMNQRREAIEAIDKLLELEPYAVNRYLAKGQLYISLGEMEEAIKAFRNYADQNPSDARVHILLGDTYRRQGNFEQSNQEYQLAQVLETNTLFADRKLYENMKREGNFSAAEQGFLQLIEDANTNQSKYEISTELRYLYEETGRIKESLDWYDTGHDLLASFAPETSVLMTKMFQSWAYARAGEIERGQELLNQAKQAVTRFDNELYRSNVLLGEAMFNVFIDVSNDPIPVLDEVQREIRDFIGNGADHTFIMMRGLAYHLTERYDEAIPFLTEYTTQFPNEDLNHWIMLAESLLVTGQTSEAVTIYQNLLVEYPSYPYAHFGLAKAHYNNADYEAAGQSLNTVLDGWQNADEQFRPKREALELKQKLAELKVVLVD